MNRKFIMAWLESMTAQELEECLACDLIAVWEGR